MSTAREFSHDGEKLRVQIDRIEDDRFKVQVGANVHEVTGKRQPDGRVRFDFDGATWYAATGPAGTGEAATRRGDLHVTIGDRSWMLEGASGGRTRAKDSGGDGVITAPMTGTVLKILVSEGDTVSATDTVAVVSAMKMEHKLTAEIDGTVAEIAATEGAQVDQDELLLRIEP